MVQVLPAIIPINKDQLSEEIKKVSPFARLIQVDISDGIFTPVKTWPYNGLDTDFFESLKKEGVGWPDWENVDVELHLMVQNPENILEDWIHTGIVGVVAHIEATEDFQKVIDICKRNEVLIGLAIKPSTDIEKIKPFENQIDFIQVMGSDSLGRHGTLLEEVALDKIKTLRGLYPERIIGIDIGVTTETTERIISAGANKLISGSAILESENPEETFNDLQSFK